MMTVTGPPVSTPTQVMRYKSTSDQGPSAPVGSVPIISGFARPGLSDRLLRLDRRLAAASDMLQWTAVLTAAEQSPYREPNPPAQLVVLHEFSHKSTSLFFPYDFKHLPRSYDI